MRGEALDDGGERMTADFGAALRELKSRADVSYQQIDRYGSQQEQPVRYPPATLDGWFSGKNVPQGGKRFELFVGYLEGQAGKKPGHQRTETLVWEQRRKVAAQARRSGGKRGDAAPQPQPISAPEFLSTGHGNQQQAVRLMKAIPVDAPWLLALRQQPSFHKVWDRVQDPLFAAQGALKAFEFLQYGDARLQSQHESLVAALNELCSELGGLEHDGGKANFAYIPPEWRSGQPERYEQTQQDLKRARDGFVREYENLVGMLSNSGLLPDSTAALE